MPRVLTSLLILSCLLRLPADARAAEARKLRHLVSIYSDDKGVGLIQPEGVACNDKSTVVVADTGKGRLVRYTLVDREVKSVVQFVAPELSAPIRVQMSSKEDVFALDGKQRRIVRFDSKGEFKDYLSPEGVPDPPSIVPRSFKIDRSDTIYLLDVFSARVLVLSSDGKYQRHVPFPDGSGFFSDLAVDGKGTIYLLDSVKATVYAARKDAKQFSPITSKLRAYLSFPTSIEVDSHGVLYLVDQHGSGIVMLGPDGAVLGRQLSMGWTEGLLYYPSQVCLTEPGQLFIADRNNNRIQVFSVVR